MPGLKEGPIHILIVEDDKVDAKKIKQEFLNFNPAFEFYLAENGVDALNKLYGRNGVQKLKPAPQILIVDILMPKMDGNELINELRKDRSLDPLTIFILTACYKTKDKVATEGLNIEHIVKPLRRSDVLHIYMTALKLPGFNIT